MADKNTEVKFRHHDVPSTRPSHPTNNSIKMGLYEEDFIALMHKRKIIPDHLTVEQVGRIPLSHILNFFFQNAFIANLTRFFPKYTNL
jgi:hypothetical protein